MLMLWFIFVHSEVYLKNWRFGNRTKQLNAWKVSTNFRYIGWVNSKCSLSYRLYKLRLTNQSKANRTLPPRHNDGNRRTPAARPNPIDGSESKIISEHRPQILHNVRRIGRPSPVLCEIPIEIAVFLVLGCVGQYWWSHFFSRSHDIEWYWCCCYCFLASLRNKRDSV